MNTECVIKSIVDSETVTSVLNKLVIGEVSDNTADMRWVGLLYSDYSARKNSQITEEKCYYKYSLATKQYATVQLYIPYCE